MNAASNLPHSMKVRNDLSIAIDHLSVFVNDDATHCVVDRHACVAGPERRLHNLTEIAGFLPERILFGIAGLVVFIDGLFQVFRGNSHLLREIFDRVRSPGITSLEPLLCSFLVTGIQCGKTIRIDNREAGLITKVQYRIANDIAAVIFRNKTLSVFINHDEVRSVQMHDDAMAASRRASRVALNEVHASRICTDIFKNRYQITGRAGQIGRCQFKESGIVLGSHLRIGTKATCCRHNALSSLDAVEFTILRFVFNTNNIARQEVFAENTRDFGVGLNLDSKLLSLWCEDFDVIGTEGSIGGMRSRIETAIDLVNLWQEFHSHGLEPLQRVIRILSHCFDEFGISAIISAFHCVLEVVLRAVFNPLSRLARGIIRVKAAA